MADSVATDEDEGLPLKLTLPELDTLAVEEAEGFCVLVTTVVEDAVVHPLVLAIGETVPDSVGFVDCEAEVVVHPLVLAIGETVADSVGVVDCKAEVVIHPLVLAVGETIADSVGFVEADAELVADTRLDRLP